MDTILKFTSHHQGKDRVFRATQFACALSTYLLRTNTDRTKLLSTLKTLEANLNAGRKVFRLGNTINSIQAAKRSLQLSDRVLCLCLTAAHVNRALYFFCDNVLWAKSVGLIRDTNKVSWSTGASRCFLLTLIGSLARDIYVVLQLMVQRARDGHFRQKMIRHLNESPQVAEVIVPHLDAFLFLLLESLKSHPAVVLDTVKNFCDLFSPLDKLGIYPSNSGVVSLCGLVSSVIGIITYVNPSLSIKP
uniref:Peroxisomal biogenesis factor 11 alpha n=1 Tax=Cynoglossus semilaevis TaxID=244447 RepID=A0A3P8W4P0_CYNSE